MITNYITSYVVGPVPGGIMISHGTLFVIAIWIIVSQTTALIRRRRKG
jgi:hypothetical protein